MAEKRTHEERIKEYTDKMGVQLGTLTLFLWQEIHYLIKSYNSYKTLYSNEKYLALANKASPNFFWNYQRIFIEHIVISIHRITEKNYKKHGLKVSVFQLQELLDNKECHSEITILLNRLSQHLEPIISYRHNVYAHYSYKIKIDKKELPSNSLTHDSIQMSFELIMKIVDSVTHHYLNKTSLPYEHLSTMDDLGSKALICKLAQASLFNEIEYSVKLKKEITPQMIDWKALL